MKDSTTTFVGAQDDVGVAAAPTGPVSTPSTGEIIRLIDGPGGRGRARGWGRTVRPYLVVSDLAAVVLALVLVPTPPVLAMLGVIVGVTVVLTCLGAYRSRLTLSALDDLPIFAAAAFVGGFTQLALRTVIGSDVHSRLLVQAVVVFALLLLTRSLAYLVVRLARSRGLVEHRALVLGAGEVGQELARVMVEHPEFGLRPVGFLDSTTPDDAAELPVPFLGRYEDLARCVRREGVSEVVVAYGATDAVAGASEDTALVRAVRECDRLDIEIFSVPRFFELHHRSRDMDELWGTPLVRVRRSSWRSGTWKAKRALDIAASGLALLMLAPLLLLVALAVRIENGPGVLFRQVRVGLDGAPVTIYKFLSIRPADLGMSEDQPRFSVNGDPAIGRISRILRSTSIDELPQLLNVLKGDMSIVGPRPEREVFVEEFSRTIPQYSERHRSPVGLTGWAQVNGLRGDTSITERARFDNYYIQNWSLWFDMKIIVRTVSAVLLKRGS
ncbi:exopolysaccharide biosynthesis polyprenyl glycosylphosphotransferase [soil metagenome]